MAGARHRDRERLGPRPRARLRCALLLAASAAVGGAPSRPGSSTRPGKIVPIPASIPHEDGDMVDQRHRPQPALDRPALPDLRHRRLLGPAAKRRTRRLRRLPRQRLRPLQRRRRRHRRRSAASPKCDAAWARDHPPRALGRADAEQSAPRPSAGSATTATPATAAATTSTSPGTTRSAPEFTARRMGRSLPGRLPWSTGAAQDAELGRPRAPPGRPAASPGLAPAASPARLRRLSGTASNSRS